MSLKRIPALGKSGTSRMWPRDRRPSALDEQSQIAQEEQLVQLAGDGRECLEVVEGGLAPLWMARSEGRRDELLEQRGLPTGGGAERTQVACVDPVPGDARARGRDVRLALAVEPLARLDPRCQEPELLQLARELGGSPPRARRARPGRSRPPARAGPGARRCARSAPGISSSSRITRSGRNSSRCSRRIVSSRSTSRR